MGVGMILIVDPTCVSIVESTLHEAGIATFEIGCIEKGDRRVTVQ